MLKNEVYFYTLIINGAEYKIKKPYDRATTGFNSFASKGRGEPFERVEIKIY